MSNKNKNKNNPDDALLQEKAWQRDSYHMTLTEKALHERLVRFEEENKALVEKIKSLSDTSAKEIQDLKDNIESVKEEREKLKKQKSEFEKDVILKSKKIEDLEEHHKKLLAHKQEEFDFEKSEFQKQIDNLEVRQENFDFFLKNKTELENEKRSLKEELDHLLKEKQRELADKDRERVQATDKLKNDMLHKIQETKTSLFALKKEQLQTTTRLTVLQNHQLTTELEYQSKQTEKLLFKNSKLQEQVTTLKRDVEIHKQVEQELAKRSHFSQKLIKKLSAKIKDLEEESENQKKNQEQNASNGPPKNKIKDSFQEEKTKDELIGFLEKNLETIEKKLAKMQNDYDILKNENQFIQKKLDSKSDKFVNLATMLSEAYEKTVKEDPEKELAGKTLELDLNDIAKKDFNDLNYEQKQALLVILLAQIKPFIKKKNLNLPEIKGMNILIINEKNPSILPKIQSIDQLPSKNEEKNRFKDVPLDISTKVIRSKVGPYDTNILNKASRISNKLF